MKRLLELAAVVAVVACTAGPALAQSLSEEPTIVEGPGMKVGEGSVLHPTLGIESGVVSNVFYEDSSPRTAGLLRLLAELHFASLSGQRIAAEQAEEGGETSEGDFQFRAGLNLAYEEYLSSDANIQKQRDLGIIADARGLVFPQRTWSFAFGDEYRREVRPTNFESSDGIDRDINNLRLILTYAPGGRALTGRLSYVNTIDIFEKDSHRFANRLQNLFALRVTYQWLPVTNFYADASIGIYEPLGDRARMNKFSSRPLRLLLGTSTAITTNTTVNAQAGYGFGFYESGESFQNVLFGGEFGWRYSPLGRVLLLYRYDFADSINANYYRDHQFKIGLTQQVAMVTFEADADVRLRHYGNVLAIVGPSAPDRDDVIVSVNAAGQYHFRDWIAATLTYTFTSDQVQDNFTANGDDPSFVRHVLLAGVLAAF